MNTPATILANERPVAITYRDGRTENIKLGELSIRDLYRWIEQFAARYLSADPLKLGPANQVFDVTALNRGWFYPLYNFFKDILRSFGLRI